MMRAGRLFRNLAGEQGRPPIPALGLAFRTDLAAVLAVVAAGLLLLVTLPWVEHAEGADEGVYLRYVREILAGGPGVFPELHRQFVQDQRLWVFPPPTRSGYLALASIWCALFGTSLMTLSTLSACCHVFSIWVAYRLARQHLGAEGGVLVAWLVAFSPLWLAVGRRALTDAPAIGLSVVAVWAFLSALREAGNHRAQLAFVGSLSMALLVKELSVLLLVPLGLAFVWEKLRARTALSWLRLGFLLATPVLIAGAVGVLAAGGPGRVIEVARIVLGSPTDNAFAQAFCAGPWYRHVIDLLLLSPLPTLLGLAGVVVTANRALRQDGDGPLLAMAVVLVVVTLAEHALLIKNVRYVALLELPLRVLAVWILAELTAGLRQGFRRPALWLVVATLVVFDLASFWELFVAGGIYDPTSFNLLAARRLIPGQ